MNRACIVLRCSCVIVLATIADAQATVEYAAKSAAGAVSGGVSSAHLGACQIDSMLVPCIRQLYPVTFYVAVVAICVFLLILMFPKRRV